MAAAPPANTQGRSHAEAQFEEGLRLAAAGKLAAATEVFARMTTDYPQLSEPYAQLAALYVRQGQPAKAIAPLQRALSLDTDKAAVQEQLGDLYVALAAEAYAAAAPTRTSARAKAAALPVVKNEHSSTGSGQ